MRRCRSTSRRSQRLFDVSSWAPTTSGPPRADDPKAARLRRHFDGVSFTILVRAAPQGHELTGCPDVLALVLVPEDGDEDDLDGKVDHGVDREPVRAVAEPDGAHADLRSASHEGDPKVGRPVSPMC
jgi:hypothetical protein